MIEASESTSAKEARRDPRTRVLEALRESPAVVFALLLVGVILWWGASEGGFLPTTWYAGGLLLLALLVTAAVALARPRPPRACVVAIGLLVAFAAWSYLSILWADDQSSALDGANLTLVYTISFVLMALWPMRAEAAKLVLGAFALGVIAIGLVELLRANAAAHPMDYFLEARFSEPVGYSNANTALWFSAFWPSVFLASRREVHPLLRGLFLGGGVLLTGLAILGQSRGWLLALVPCVVVFLVLVDGRGRLIAALGAVAVTMPFVAPSALDVNRRLEYRGNIAPLLSDAVGPILKASLVMLVVGVVIGFVDRAVDIGERRSRGIGRAVVAGFVVMVALAIGGYSVEKGSPVHRVSTAWSQFKQSDTSPGIGANRFATFQTYRYDAWRVAWLNFKRRPLTGVGVDNFGRDYRKRGRTGQEPRFPHSLEMRLLSETGLVGTALLLGSWGAALWLVLAGMRRGRIAESAVAGTAVTVFAYWVAHGSVDWFWEMPVTGLIGFAMLGLAVAVATRGRGSPPAPSEGERGPRGRVAPVAGAAVAVLALLALGLPYLSARETSRAADVWQVNLDAALTRLDRAESLNPLSTTPALSAGTFALRSGRLDRAETELRSALDRDPRDQYALLNLGAIVSVRQSPRAAVPILARARHESPHDELTAGALRRAASGRSVEPRRLNRRIFENGRLRLGLQR